MFNQRFDNMSFGGRSFSNYGRGGIGVKAPYNPFNNNSPQRSYPIPVKHSGAKIKEGKNGKPCISAWRKTRNAFMTLIACPNNGKNTLTKTGKTIVNKKGEEYARWTCTLVERNTGSISTHSGLYNTATHKLYIPELKLVANPQAPNGGYFGKSYVSRRR